MDVGTIMAAVLSAGGVTFLTTLFQGVRSMRAGARAAQKEAIEDLRGWQARTDVQLQDCRADIDYWRDLAAERGSQLRLAGLVPADPTPIPPSRRKDTSP